MRSCWSSRLKRRREPFQQEQWLKVELLQLALSMVSSFQLDQEAQKWRKGSIMYSLPTTEEE